VDVDAGMPILGACVASVLLLLWMIWQKRWIERCVWVYSRRQAPMLTSPLRHIHLRVRRLMFSSLLATPAIMFFSGQLDAHGIAHVYNNTLQIIAPLTSACFAAAMLWLLIVSPLAVYTAHCRLLDLFYFQGHRREFW